VPYRFQMPTKPKRLATNGKSFPGGGSIVPTGTI